MPWKPSPATLARKWRGEFRRKKSEAKGSAKDLPFIPWKVAHCTTCAYPEPEHGRGFLHDGSLLMFCAPCASAYDRAQEKPPF